MRWWCAVFLVGCQSSPIAPEVAPVPAPKAAPRVEAARDFVGVIVAEKVVEVTPRLAGRVAEVKDRLGDEVRAGQIVAALDARALRADLDAARAALGAARTDVDRVRLEVDESREKSGRAGKLKEYVSQEELSGVRYREKQAETRLERARA